MPSLFHQEESGISKTWHQKYLLGAFIGYFTLFIFMTVTIHALSPQQHRHNEKTLSQVYQEIASKALRVKNWPDSTNADLLFQRGKNGEYLIPSFEEQEAPLGVTAIVDRNKDARRITQECDQIFASFVNDLVDAIAATDSKDPREKVVKHDVAEELEKYIWRVPEGTHHMTLAVFQENPSLLLDEAEKLKCQRVEEHVAMKVYQEISNYINNTDQVYSPRLKLDSLLLTGDGAMIAGFIDTSNLFEVMRTSLSGIAAAIIGDLTSRPKKLMHVTVGRVLALPQDLSPTQRQAVNSLVRQYNSDILPKKVTSMKNTMPQEASFALTELTMIRDIVWTLRKIKEYGTFHLHEPEDKGISALQHIRGAIDMFG